MVRVRYKATPTWHGGVTSPRWTTADLTLPSGNVVFAVIEAIPTYPAGITYQHDIWRSTSSCRLPGCTDNCLSSELSGKSSSLAISKKRIKEKLSQLGIEFSSEVRRKRS